MLIRKLAGVAALAIAVSACATPATPSGTTPASGSDSQAATSAPPKDYHLGWYAPAAHPYFDQVKIGVEQFIKETGIPVDIQIGPDWNQSSETEHVEAMAAQGMKGLAMYPSDAAGANSLIDELADKGISVVNWGADSKRPNKSTFVAATDVSAAAYNACTELIKRMGDKGNMINVLEVLEDANTALRKDAVAKCVSEHPNVKVIQEVAGIKNAEEAVTKMEAALSANTGKVDGILTTGFNPSVGLAQLLPDYYSKNPGKHIATITIDTDPTVLKSITDGVIDGTMAQNPVGQGYISMKVLTLLQDGYKPASDNPAIDSGQLLVTKDNVTSYETDLEKVTQQILSELTTKYLTK